MRRLALFWLVCASVGFAVAACAAFVLSLAIDHQAIWRQTSPTPIARMLDSVRPRPRNGLSGALANAKW